MSQSTESRPELTFRHERIDDNPPCGRMVTSLPTDLTGNGHLDLIVSGWGRAVTLALPGRTIKLDNVPVFNKLYRSLEPNVFWYENLNPGWKRHIISPRGNLYALGGTLADIDGDGRLDLVVGQALGGHDIYWLEQPADPRKTWEKHLVSSQFDKYHDFVVADVDDDGEPELLGCSQESEVVFYYDIPEDPTVEPWPDSNLHIVCEDLDITGLLVCDIDGDGETEIVAGPNVFHRVGDEWEREVVAEGWAWTRLATADLDGDGDLELVMAEGEHPVRGGLPGRAAVFDYDGETWTPTMLHDQLSNPHTLQIADFDGDGHPDIYVAEMGLQTDSPRQFIFRNRGDGTFDEEIISEGIATHEAKAVDVNGDGRPDLIGKSYHPTEHVDVWYNETDF